MVQIEILTLFLIKTYLLIWVKSRDIYVSPSGDGTDCSLNSPCTVTTSNTEAKEGDTVHLKGGIYYEALEPSQSGSKGKPILIRSMKGETVIFRKGGTQLVLNSKSHFIFDGLIFDGSGESKQTDFSIGSNYVEVKNCIFQNASWGPIRASGNYGYIHDNIFRPLEEATSVYPYHESDTLHISGEYNRFENNILYEGGGHGFFWVSSGKHNVFRNNTGIVTTYWNNAQVPDSAGLDICLGLEKKANFNLFEGNTLIGIGDIKARTFFAQLNGCYGNIFRRNIAYGTRAYTSTYINRGFGNEKNAFYHNTFFDVGGFTEHGGFFFLNAGDGLETKNNYFFNNILHTYPNNAIKLDIANVGFINDNQFRGNLFFNIGKSDVVRFNEPMTMEQAEKNYKDEFSDNIVGIDPKLIDPQNGKFALKKDSPARNKGVFLTKITSASSSGSNVMIVDKPELFYDGWTIPGEIGDSIKTEGGNKAVITKIDYSTGEITLDKAIPYEIEEGVSIDYTGIAPDIGAMEYNGYICGGKTNEDDACGYLKGKGECGENGQCICYEEKMSGHNCEYTTELTNLDLLIIAISAFISLVLLISSTIIIVSTIFYLIKVSKNQGKIKNKEFGTSTSGLVEFMPLSEQE